MVKLSIKEMILQATDREHMHLCPPMCAFDSEARIGAWFTFFCCCCYMLATTSLSWLQGTLGTLQNFVNGPPFDGVCPLCHMFH